MLLLLATLAVAADAAPYERALSLIEEHYLYPAAIDRRAMFTAAATQLERRIEWLVTAPTADGVRLADGDGRWSVEVPLDGPATLTASLARLEDAVHAAGLPLAPDVDPRVEILRGMVKGLDRHTAVLAGSSLTRFDERLSGTLSGIGASLRLEAGELTVSGLTAGSPAERGGLRPADRVLRIDGQSTVGMTLTDATGRIKGAPGTAVTLTVSRAGEILDLTFVREEVRLRNVEARRGPGDVAVLSIEHFSEQTQAWLLQSLDELRGEDGGLDSGLVVDVRGNTGGSLIQSAYAADAFIDRGLIVSTVGPDGAPVSGLVPRIDAHRDRTTYEGPIVVLVDHQTASGAEILAGALAQADRALLVGAPSFGKGTVQKVYEITPGVKLKLTVAEYRLADDLRVNEVGLRPDLALSEYRFGEDGVWYADPTRERGRVGAGIPILPVVVEEPGWRPDATAPADHDDPLDVAARVVAAGEGPGRADLLDAAALLMSRLRDAADQRLQQVFGLRGIDWGPAPAGARDVVAAVRARLEVDGDLVAGETVTLIASVRNEGPALHRAAVRLRSDNPLWDDRVLPLGYLGAGASGTGTVVVDIPVDAATRADDVQLWVEAENAGPAPLVRRTLQVDGGDRPAIAATLRLRVDDGTATATVALENRGDLGVDGLQARFEFPDQPGVELVEPQSAPVRLSPGEEQLVDLHLRLSPEWSAPDLPLVLVLESEEWGSLASWAVELPIDGRRQRLEPPTLSVESPPVQPPGRGTLSLTLTDDTALDHVVVFAGAERIDRSRWEPRVRYEGEKVTWRKLAGRRAELELDVPVEPGVNRYEVTVQDRAGLRLEAVAYVLGASAPEMADGGAE